MVDPETGGVVVFDTGGPEAAAFAPAARAAVDAREALFKRLSMDPIEVRTDRALPARADDVLRGARAEAAALSDARLSALAALRAACWRGGAARGRAPTRGRRDAQAAAARRSRRAHRGGARRQGRGARRRSDPTSASWRSAKSGRAREPAGHASIWGRSRCSTGTRPASRTWATGGSAASSRCRSPPTSRGRRSCPPIDVTYLGARRRGEDGPHRAGRRSRSPA